MIVYGVRIKTPLCTSRLSYYTRPAYTTMMYEGTKVLLNAYLSSEMYYFKVLLLIYSYSERFFPYICSFPYY